MPPNPTRTIGKRLTRAALCAWRFSWITYLPGWPDLKALLAKLADDRGHSRSPASELRIGDDHDPQS
jgi:hypothetical protein